MSTLQELFKANPIVKKFKLIAQFNDYKPKEIKAFLEEMGVPTVAKKGFAAEFYGFLSAELRSKDEATAYVMGTGDCDETSDNVQKHLTHYIGIWELTKAIWEAKTEVEVDDIGTE